MKGILNSAIYWSGFATAMLAAWILQLVQWWQGGSGTWIVAYSFGLAITYALHARADGIERDALADLMSKAHENIKRMDRGPL